MGFIKSDYTPYPEKRGHLWVLSTSKPITVIKGDFTIVDTGIEKRGDPEEHWEWSVIGEWAASLNAAPPFAPVTYTRNECIALVNRSDADVTIPQWSQYVQWEAVAAESPTPSDIGDLSLFRSLEEQHVPLPAAHTSIDSRTVEDTLDVSLLESLEQITHGDDVDAVSVKQADVLTSLIDASVDVPVEAVDFPVAVVDAVDAAIASVDAPVEAVDAPVEAVDVPVAVVESPEQTGHSTEATVAESTPAVMVDATPAQAAEAKGKRKYVRKSTKKNAPEL